MVIKLQIKQCNLIYKNNMNFSATLYFAHDLTATRNLQVSAEELIKMVASSMMDQYKLRGGVKFLPSLPHTHSGKISRKELKAVAKTLVIY